MKATAQRGKTLPQQRAKPDTAVAPEVVRCPECGVPAVMEWSDMVDSTDGPVEHAKIVCANRHWFLLPTEGLHRI
jgi:hypothetical protein